MKKETEGSGICLKAFSERQAREVCTWRYPPPYDVYDLPAWEEVQKRKWGIADPQIRVNEFVSVYEGTELIGFAKLQRKESIVWLGIALHPKRCGQGNGKRVMELLKSESLLRFGRLPICLEVQAWNKRAQNCYHSAGFHHIKRRKKQTLEGEKEYVLMKYAPLFSQHR